MPGTGSTRRPSRSILWPCWQATFRPRRWGWSSSGHHCIDRNYGPTGSEFSATRAWCPSRRWPRMTLMLVRVTEVNVLDGYRLRLAFSDGAVGEIDLAEELWGEVFEPLREEALFRQARVDPELGTVVWPNGADLDPESLRANAHLVKRAS